MKLTIAMLLVVCAGAQSIRPEKVIDLTYPFNEKTIFWPNAKGFEHRKDGWAKTPGGYWYAAGGFRMDEHGGTHLDSPVHFAEGKQTLDQIAAARLIAPVVVIDVSGGAKSNADYLASPNDVAGFEKQHGPIRRGAIVLFRTGWGQFWPNKKKYLGSDVAGDTAHLHFPGIAPATAKLLVARGVTGVGIDTASTDYGASKDFQTHQILSAANIYGIENVAYIEKLPATGATLIVAPMKIENGTGGPVRLLAILP